MWDTLFNAKKKNSGVEPVKNVLKDRFGIRLSRDEI